MVRDVGLLAVQLLQYIRICIEESEWYLFFALHRLRLSDGSFVRSAVRHCVRPFVHPFGREHVRPSDRPTVACVRARLFVYARGNLCLRLLMPLSCALMSATYLGSQGSHCSEN